MKCRLPSLTIGGAEYEFPLADGTALLLAEMFVAGVDDFLLARLRKVLAVDPPFVAWIWLQADLPPPATIARLAHWLVTQGFDRLVWQAPAATPSEPPGPMADLDQPLAERAARDVLVAETAALLAESQHANNETAYLAGLLSDVESWCEPLDSRSPDSQIVASTVRLRIGGNEAVIHCAATASLVVREGRRLPTGIRRPRQILEQAAEAARQHWLVVAPGAAAWLPNLATRLSRLRELETNFDQLLEREKLESLAEFAAGAGHEMNNPLAVISGRAQLFLRDEPNPERRRELALINGQALRVHEMIADLMLFARPPQPKLERLDIATLLFRIAAELRDKSAERRIKIRHEVVAEPLTVMADPTQLLVAFRAIGDNALNALGTDGEIEFTASLQEAPAHPSANDSTQPKVVVVTSLQHDQVQADQVETLAVTADAVWVVASARLGSVPHGGGDLLAALLLGLLALGRALPDALGGAVSAVYEVLRASVGEPELRLVAGARQLAAPALLVVRRLAAD